MKVRRPYAFCCIGGGGRVDGCTCSQPEHGYAIVDVRAMLPGDEPTPTDAVRDLIDWARREQAFPIGNPGGEGRGHIDENHRFRLRDMVEAIDALSTLSADAIRQGEGLPQSVITLVIAAREAFDTGMLPEDEQAALDKALEPFASSVPYANEPATPASHASDGGKA